MIHKTYFYVFPFKYMHFSQRWSTMKMPFWIYATHFPLKYSVSAVLLHFQDELHPSSFSNELYKKKKSDVTRLEGLCGRCCNTSHLYTSSQALVFLVKCGRSLHFHTAVLHFLSIIAFSSPIFSFYSFYITM